MTPSPSIIITVTGERNLELPPEIKEKIKPGEQYIVSTEDDKIIFQKAPKFDWDEWQKRLEEGADDPEQLSIEEICEIVREVRRENRKK